MRVILYWKSSYVKEALPDIPDYRFSSYKFDHNC